MFEKNCIISLPNLIEFRNIKVFVIVQNIRVDIFNICIDVNLSDPSKYIASIKKFDFDRNIKEQHEF